LSFAHKATLHNSAIYIGPDANQVIEIPIRKSLNIKIYRHTINLQLRIANDMDLILLNGLSFQ